jgi:hypothetical protein
MTADSASVEQILDERGRTHGSFAENARISVLGPIGMAAPAIPKGMTGHP